MRRRSDRLMVDLGGVLVELTVAVYATLFWCFLPDGPARTVAFAIATSSWVLVAAGQPEPVHALRRLLSSFGQSRDPEPAAPRVCNGEMGNAPVAFRTGRSAFRRNSTAATHRGLIAYAYGVWIYRFFLFIAISLLVYSMFFKLAGVFLLLVSVSAFIVKPRSCWKCFSGSVHATGSGDRAGAS